MEITVFKAISGKIFNPLNDVNNGELKMVEHIVKVYKSPRLRGISTGTLLKVKNGLKFESNPNLKFIIALTTFRKLLKITQTRR